MPAGEWESSAPLEGAASALGGPTYRVPITVCHYPPGTSKWNKIEHRLFSFVSMNWRGRRLVSYEAIVNLIGHTTIETGLKVRAMLDSAITDGTIGDRER